MKSNFLSVLRSFYIHKLLPGNMLAGCFLAILILCIFPGISDLQAGQTYFYDAKGKLITEEEYRKIVEQIGGQVEEPSVKEAETDDSSEDENTPDSEKQDDQALEEEDEEDIEALYQIEVSSETIFRAFERDTDKQDDATAVPAYQYLRSDLSAYQYLRLDLGALDQGGLSLHMYGWGRYDFNDSDSFDDNPDGELLYGYLEYNRPEYGFNFTVGRQHVMAGIINNSIDGLGVKSALTPYFKLALYGGSPVELSSEDGRSGDSIWGGRVAGHLAAEYEIGLSYKKKKSDGDNDEEMAGFDLFAQLPFNINFFGFSSYNMDTKGWGEHSYDIRFDILGFNFRPFYQRFRYEDFFNTKDNSANQFRFLAGSGEILSSLGTDVIWQWFDQLDLGAKLNLYDYDRRDDQAIYFEGNANWKINGLSQIGGQLGRMNGDSDETRYLLTRAFFYWNEPGFLSRLGFITGDAMYVHYDKEIYSQDYSLWLSLGAGMRFFDDAMEVKLSGDWSHDPLLDSNIRGLLKVQYTY